MLRPISVVLCVATTETLQYHTREKTWVWRQAGNCHRINAMPKEAFAIADFSFRVFRSAAGSIHWRGEYQGMKVVAAQPVDNDSKCLILLDTMASKEPTFENLLSVESEGDVVWKAELPQSHDTFVSFQGKADGLLANMWSGYRVRLDPATGKLMQKQFVE